MPAISQIDFKHLARTIDGEVFWDDHQLGIYSTDASVYQIRPKAVVLPKSESDVVKAVAFAREHGISILPRGGGTSLAGQTVGASLVLDFSKYLNQVIELNLEQRWVRVQPGIVRDVLNEYLKPHGLHFAPDPATSSRANIGGMIGNNSSGTKSILYGKTVDHVLETRVLTSDGEIMDLGPTPESSSTANDRNSPKNNLIKVLEEIVDQNEQEIRSRYPKVMRRVGGYNLDEFLERTNWNLAKIVTGSEGTLAVTLEAKLNLEPLPKYKSVCVVHFADLMQAIRAVKPMLKYAPSAVEILDETVIKLSRENLTTQRSCQFLEGDPEAILIVEFYGETEKDVLLRPQQMVEELIASGYGYAHPIFPEGPEYDDVWVIRKKGLGLMLGIKGDKKPLPFIEDAGIPVDALPHYIESVLKLCADLNTEVAMYAHASVGVIHVRPILDLRRQEDIDRFNAISRGAYQLAKGYGGSWSGEHGDGLVRSAYIKDYFGNALYAAFVRLKQTFDPVGLMNPGKIVDAQPIDQNFRYGPNYKDEAVDHVFQFREESGFEAAVHMCTGVGECRKVIGGTMCPSFKATRDEEHSTRGRANALRLAMSGQLTGGLTSERLHQTLDLCLSCKACKSECPSNVDMAKLKSEILHAYYREKGTTLRDRMVRDSEVYARRFSGRLAPAINWIQGTPMARWLQSKILGIHAFRILPRYTNQTLQAWNDSRPAIKQGGSEVALFSDCYMSYHETGVGKAAIELLERLGYEVTLASIGCCQRPRISHGFLEEAKADGTRTAVQIDQLLQRDIPVLVCEPSCVSALQDDLPDLVDDEELAGRLRSKVVPLESFLARTKLTPLTGIPTFDKYVVHGHCHQKALYGTSDMKKVLAKLTGIPVVEIDSGCCGMAGSFGYETEHYGLSRDIAEQELLPAVAKLGPGDALVAPGFSCRHQIEHFSGRKASHWVEALTSKSTN